VRVKRRCEEERDKGRDREGRGMWGKRNSLKMRRKRRNKKGKGRRGELKIRREGRRKRMEKSR
jgi:hypothetical protein